MGLVTTIASNVKISEVEDKIPNTSTLVTTTVFSTKINEVENQIPDHAKYPEFNQLNVENFAARIKQADLLNKTDFDNKTNKF